MNMAAAPMENQFDALVKMVRGDYIGSFVQGSY